LQAYTMTHRGRFSNASVRMRPGLLLDKIATRSERLQDRSERLGRISLLTLEQKRQQLDAAGRLLESLSHKGVLARGFALVRDRDNAPLRRAADIKAGQGLSLEFADGSVSAVAGLLDPVELHDTGAASSPAPSSSSESSNESTGIMASDEISAKDIEATLRDIAGVRSPRRTAAKPIPTADVPPSPAERKADSQEAAPAPKPKPKRKAKPKPPIDDGQGSMF
jgi:exodeoxyribonuclease VII large subunit